MTCRTCTGFVRREPAAVCCALCGRRGDVFDAPERQRLAQRMLDVALRPCSAECHPLYNVPRPLGWQPGRRGEVRLPGEPEMKARRRP